MTIKFAADMKAWSEEAKAKMDTVVRVGTMDIIEEVVRTTPVDTGFMRSTWAVDLNERSTRPLLDKPEGLSADGGTLPIDTAAISLAIQAGKAGDVFFVSNGARYAAMLEFGTSKMAPRAWVRAVMARAQLIFDEAARRIGGAK